MATNIQMNIKKSSGSYDILYPQTTAGQIASGTLSTDRIPSLPASKITEGTFSGTKTGEYIFPGNVRVGGTGSSSNAKIRIGDSDYVYLHEDSDDNLTIKAKRIEFTTSSSPGITNNGVAIGGGAPNVSSATGTLSIAHGGTGATTASAAIYGLTNGLSTRSASSINSYPSSTYIPCYYSTTGYKFPISNLLTYIQNNVSSGRSGLQFKYGSRTGSGSTGYSVNTGLNTVICYWCSRNTTYDSILPWSALITNQGMAVPDPEGGYYIFGFFTPTKKNSTVSWLEGNLSTGIKNLNMTYSSGTVNITYNGSKTFHNLSSYTYYWGAIGT